MGRRSSVVGGSRNSSSRSSSSSRSTGGGGGSGSGSGRSSNRSNSNSNNDNNDNDDNNGFPWIFDDFGMDLRLSGALKTLVFPSKKYSVGRLARNG